MPLDAREALTRKTRAQFPELNLPVYNVDVCSKLLCGCLHIRAILSRAQVDASPGIDKSSIFRAAENGDYDLVERILRLDGSASRRTRPGCVCQCTICTVKRNYLNYI